MSHMPNLFTFDPRASDAPLARGRHEAEIIAAEARTSRAGNPMLDMTYRVAGPTGEVALKDYLVSTPRSKWKIKRFCQTLGLDFEAGKIDPLSLIGRRLSVEVGIEDDGQGRDRNVVSDYITGFGFGEGDSQPQANGHGSGPKRLKTLLAGVDDTGSRIRSASSSVANDDGEDIPF